MRTHQTKNIVFCAILAGLLATATVGQAAAKGGGGSKGGGGGSGNTVVGFEVGRHLNSQIWVQGKKETSTYSYTGTSWLLFATQPPSKSTERNVAPPTIAFWGDVLENKYSVKDPSGTKVKEVVKTQGIGMGIIERDVTTGLGFALIGGIERAFISQTGDTPRSQRYPFGLGARAGIGWSPFKPDWSPYMRVDYTFKHFPTATWNGQALKPIQVQSFVPCLGFTVAF